ncbi:MAG: choloylglycine hydrolase [Clostridia bacterium]|nr:choloylglycine hydrolase [Clostridia bacterium]
MCTAITYKTKDHYFGRNLDLEYSYTETVTVMPRNFPLMFRHKGTMSRHFAIIGMAYVVDGYPLYYDAINENGLAMAGLSFTENADYKDIKENFDNITPFEFIPWILGQCRDIDEALRLLGKVNIIDESFSNELPNTPLHWMIADKDRAIVVEQVKDGLKVHNNPVGVLTNNPEFNIQLFGLNNYMGLSREPIADNFCKDIKLNAYSRGMGALGLPGDLSSASRFIRATFTKLNSISGEGEEESVSQFFHILTSVEQQRGLVHLGENKYEITVYSSCCNLDKGIYYYKTYDNHRITAVDMHKENLDLNNLISYPLLEKEDILYIN